MGAEMKKKNRFLRSLSFKVVVLLTSITVVLGTLLFWLTSTAYYNASFEDYGRLGKSYLDAASVLVTPEELAIVVGENGNETAEYAALEKDLSAFYDQSDEFVSYLYVYQFYRDDSGEEMIRVIYDFDPDTADEYGTTFSMDEDYEAEEETPLLDPYNKETVGPLVTKGNWGWLISVYRPINAADGKVLAYVCVDVNVTSVIARTEKLARSVFFIELTFLTAYILAIYLSFRFFVLNPLRKLERTANNFKENKVADNAPSDVVRSKDEFGALYRAFTEMEAVIVEDRQKLQEYVEKVRAMAYQDELTGVKNLNSYDRKTEELDQQIKAGTARFAIVMIDMNGLKSVNDTYGHGQGDVALRLTSHTICDTFKHSPVYRIGGDEFVVVLEGTDYENRDSLISGLRRGEVERDMTAPDPWNQFAVAVGSADFDPESHKSTKNVFDQADSAMYEHKKVLGGREHAALIH